LYGPRYASRNGLKVLIRWKWDNVLGNSRRALNGSRIRNTTRHTANNIENFVSNNDIFVSTDQTKVIRPPGRCVIGEKKNKTLQTMSKIFV